MDRVEKKRPAIGLPSPRLIWKLETPPSSVFRTIGWRDICPFSPPPSIFRLFDRSTLMEGAESLCETGCWKEFVIRPSISLFLRNAERVWAASVERKKEEGFRSSFFETRNEQGRFMSHSYLLRNIVSSRGKVIRYNHGPTIRRVTLLAASTNVRPKARLKLRTKQFQNSKYSKYINVPIVDFSRD